MRLDSHQHFWEFNTAEYGWIDPNWPIRRDFYPADLEPHLDEHGFHASIVVQARQVPTESDWLLSLAEATPRIAGVVGWVDLCADSVEQELERLSANPKFRGVRHIVQDEPDDAFILRPDFVRGVEAVQRLGLVYDVLVFPKQLGSAVEFARGLPEHVLVLDHIAKPPIADGELGSWKQNIQDLARLPNVFCKVSGMVTEASWVNWKPEDFDPYVDVVLDAFGPERLMYGSDWPVCLLAASYEQVVRVAERFATRLSEDEQRKFFGDTAARCYGIG